MNNQNSYTLRVYINPDVKKIYRYTDRIAALNDAKAVSESIKGIYCTVVAWTSFTRSEGIQIFSSL